MRASLWERRTWLCRLAERCDAVGSPPSGQTRDGEREDRLARWLRRHVERCAYCQRESAQWEQTVAWLQSARKWEAPPGVLDRVMAEIAREREHSPAPALPSAGSGESNVPLLPLASDRAGLRELEIGLAHGLLAVIGGHAMVAGTVPQMIGLTYQVFTSIEVALGRWQSAVSQALSVVETAAHALPAGMQPYVAALFWYAAGLVIAAGVSKFSIRWTPH